MEALHHLIYQSTAVMAFSGRQLSQLMYHVQQRNQAAGITGMLWYDGSRFLQIMEGPAPALERMFARIRLDCRHAQLQVLANGPIRYRQFDTSVTAIVNGQIMPSGYCEPPCPPLLAVRDKELWMLLEDFQRTALASTASLN